MTIPIFAKVDAAQGVEDGNRCSTMTSESGKVESRALRCRQKPRFVSAELPAVCELRAETVICPGFVRLKSFVVRGASIAVVQIKIVINTVRSLALRGFRRRPAQCGPEWAPQHERLRALNAQAVNASLAFGRRPA